MSILPYKQLTDMQSRQTSWVPVPPDSDFPLQNLPYGIFDDGRGARAGVAIGGQVADLAAIAALGGFEGIGLDASAFSQSTLNAYIAQGKAVWQAVRARLQEILGAGNAAWEAKAAQILVPQAQARMLLPVSVPDYTDFYSSIEHATNVGVMFRGKENALMPNWKHLPVGYHGRASSIVVSGTDLHRPKGQMRPADAEMPIYGPSKRMDFELEMAFIVGRATQLGDSVPVAQAEDYLFGFVLFNDWSARDLQQWEYVPLGPFLGKNFGSSVSPWIVTLDALEPFRVAGPQQDPQPLPYLRHGGAHNFDIRLEVAIAPETGGETVVSRSNTKYLYWSTCQQLAHHTVNGCNINVGDMMASGTISGPDKGSYGSMLELSWGGKEAIPMHDGSERRFLEDGDTVVMRGHCEHDGLRIGFGEVRGKLLPPKA
jgi:fumarylacetoacetase